MCVCLARPGSGIGVMRLSEGSAAGQGGGLGGQADTQAAPPSFMRGLPSARGPLLRAQPGREQGDPIVPTRAWQGAMCPWDVRSPVLGCVSLMAVVWGLQRRPEAGPHTGLDACLPAPAQTLTASPVLVGTGLSIMGRMGELCGR